jgi:hypothetical protein
MSMEDYKKRKLEETKRSLGATRDFEPMFPSSFSGALKTLDDNTAKPIRYATNEAIKTGKPWEFFKGLAKSVTEEVPDVSGKEIAGNLGLSQKEYSPDQTKPMQYSGSGISESPFKGSPAGMVGFGLENLLDAENLFPVGKAMAVGGLALGGLKKVGKNIVTSVNPTGTVFTKYNPELRYIADLGENITTLDKTMKINPNETITIYRGAPKNQSKINKGDFVTTNKQLAKDYAGNGHIIEEKVKASEILDDMNEPMGEEYIYRPKPSITDNPNFKNWFGDSKVVDEEGKPLVVYHGTDIDFDEFDNKKAGNKRWKEAGEGLHFFSSKPSVAGGYTKTVNGEYKEKANIIPSFISLKNPLIVDGKSGSWFDVDFKNKKYNVNEIAQEAKKSNKYDGVIIKNIKDNGSGPSLLGNTVIAFSPTQIKSATGNQGTFDPQDPNILKALAPVGPWMLYQQQKGEE